jgi:hypothetical protein
MTTHREEKEPEIAALASLWREGKISTEELSHHLKRRQLPLFPGLERRYLPLFTPAEQEQLTLFLTAQQRQLTLSLVAEVKDEDARAGNPGPVRVIAG